MSTWEAEKAERNRHSIARLTKSLPGIFPSAVLSRALDIRVLLANDLRALLSPSLGAAILFCLA